MAFETIKDLITVNVPTKESGFQFNGRLWTRSSPDYLSWKGANEFCNNRSTLLNTLDEAVEFRFGSKGDDDSHLRQWSRTLIGYSPDGEAGNRAYLFEPNADELKLVLARPEIVNNQNCLLLDTKEDLGKCIKRFASETDRTFIVPAEDLKLNIHPDASGHTEYGTSEKVKVFMPTQSEQNAAYILANQDKVHRDYCGFGHIWFARPVLKEGQMLVRPVGLGGSGYYYGIDGVDADVDFSYDRRARGVASAR